MSTSPSRRRIRGGALHVLLAVSLTLGLGALVPATAAATSPTTSSNAPANSAAVAPAAKKTVAKCAKNGRYLARYFRGTKFRGKAVKKRCERRIIHTYAQGESPVGQRNFSATWTRKINVRAHRFDFRAVADKRVVIKVDGKRVAARNKAGKYVSAVRSLRRGTHRIQFRYVKRGRTGYIKGEYVRAPDRVAPRRPTKMRAKAGDGVVALQWRGSNEVDLRGYRVYRNGKRLAEVTGTNYTDSKARNGKKYRYWVRAIDYRGNDSRRTNVRNAKPQDSTPPATPRGFKATARDGEVELSWEANAESDLRDYLIRRNGKPRAKVKAGTEQYDDNDVENGTEYAYTLIARDKAGNKSAPTGEKSATPKDDVAPNVPTLEKPTEQDGAVVLNWSDTLLDEPGGHYEVYRDTDPNVDTDKDPLAGEVQAPTYTDGAVMIGTTYYYRVVAVDQNDNPSGPSDVKSITVGDQEAPEAPTDLAATGDDGSVSLEWTSSASNDVIGYRIYRSTNSTVDISPANLVKGVGDVTTYDDRSVENGTTYYYAVIAVDKAGNPSPSSTTASATPTDSTAPSAPSGLTAFGGDGVVELEWAASAEDDVAGYRIYRGESTDVPTGPAATPISGAGLVPTAAFTDDTVTNGSTYHYAVVAVDENGNVSEASESAAATPTDSTPPASPTGLVADAGDGVVDLDWDDNADSDLEHYVVYRGTAADLSDAEPLDEVTDSAYSDSAVENGTTYHYYVVAVDGDGNESPSSEPVEATPVDASAPTAPTGLAATGLEESVELSWDENGEEDLAGYNVFRAEVPEVPTDGDPLNAEPLSEPTYLDETAVAGTQYFYVVVAVDEAGNTSAPSEPVDATPQAAPDTTAPVAPAGLEATAGDAQIDLTWDENGDEDLAGYNVYRGDSADVSIDGDPLNAQLLEEAGFTDETAEAGTEYFYVVTAVDDSDNESDPSESAGATIEGPPVDVHEKYSFTTTADTNVPQGYTKNDGSAWIGAAGLGWVTEASLDGTEHEPLDLTKNTRVRTRAAVSDLQNRLIHLTYGDIEPPSDNGIHTPGAFERTVPDGWYKVKVSVGDQPGGAKAGCPAPCYDSQHTINVEGETAIDEFQATAAKEYEAGTVTVQVTDGRLTIDAIGGTNTKLNYLELDSTDEPDTDAPATPAGVSATPGDADIEVAWDGNGEDDLAGYNVYRGESDDVSTDGDPLNAQLLEDPSFTDDTADPGTEYFYVVTAVDESGNESAASEPSQGATVPEAPELHEKYSFTTTADEDVPEGYTKNDGSAWTDAAGIGWVTQASLGEAEHTPLDLTRNTRVRSARTGVSELQRRIIHLQYGDVEPPGTNGELTAGAFERSVPDGWYEVKVSVGDEEGGAGYDSQHTINVEGENAIDEFQATSDNEFDDATVTVRVNDGRLTVDALGGTNTKLNYLEVDSTDEPTEPDFHENVRFADEDSTPPAGYLKDFGQAYGDRTGADQGEDLSYGWLELGTDNPASLVGNGRDRVAIGDAPPGTPALRSGLMHMQLPENATNGVHTPGYWELEVPDGTYDVEVSVGDAGPTVDSEHWLNVEGQNAIAAFVPTGGAGSATHHTTAERTVTVTDGRLTVSPESGTNTKINWVTIDSVPGSNNRPSVLKTTPANLATGLPPASTSVVADLDLVGGGVDPDSLGTDSVRLTNVSSGNAVAGNALTSGGADTINFSPTNELSPNTLYRLEITNGVEDVDGNAFVPYSMVFTTGNSDTGGGPVAFDKSDSGAPKGAGYTSVVKGPDGKLYAGSITGEIYRFDIGADGTLSNRQTINTVKQYSNGAASGDTYQKGNRTVIGLAFDPGSTADDLTLWISDNAPYLGQSNVPDSTGRIAKLTGPNLGDYTAVLEHLPRSVKDHETNSLAFGPDGALYFNQGANNAMGAPDGAWANRAERLLSAAVLRLDTDKLPSDLPLDVGTGNAGDYDPFASDAPLTVYGHGVRNAYDLVWHSNGHLYVPTNGSAAGGNVPEVPDDLPEVCANRPDGGYTGPKVAAEENNPAETDYIFDILKGQYYGHPNPSRCEYVLNNGNPTAGTDPFENSKYPVGTQPDPNYALSDVYDAGSHASANGVIEYEGGAFGGALDGKLLYIRYSSGQDIATFDVAADGTLSNRTFGRTGFTGFNQPLDLTEDNATGNIYVTELTNNQSNTAIVLLKPRGGGGGPVANVTDRLVFSGQSGSTSDARDAVIDNDGSDDLVITGASLGGSNAGQFALGSTTFPKTVEEGGSLDLPVTFKPTSTGVKTATVNLVTNAGTKTVRLRGLAASGLGGSNEPSLQRIMDTWDIPIDVGDPDPSNASMPSTQGMIGDEIPAQLFKKAAFDSPISITPIAAYGPQNDDPAIQVGWYDEGDADGLHEQFSVAADDAQGLMIDPDGETTNIDPGEDNAFGLYSEWPYFNGRTAYTEDALNTWDSGLPHHVRVYPFKNPDGSVEPNTYVVATEEVPGPGFDTQDIVLVVTNVKPYAPEAADAVLETENLDGVPYDDRLAFSRIQAPADGNQKTHDVASVRISNTGAEAMQVTGLNISGPFAVESGADVPFVVEPGDHRDVSVRFTATGGAVHEGTLTIVSNAGTNGDATVELAGFWQSQSEGGQEPSVAEMMQVFGYGTNIPSNLNGHGHVAAVGDEVLSPYWKRADTSKDMTVRQLSAFHTYPGGAAVRWFEKDGGGTHNLTGHDTAYAQSLLPPRNGDGPVPVSFDTSEVFGFQIDGESSDPTKNNQSADETNGCPGPCGHHVRFFPVKDRAGDVVPNSYLMMMDYSGINYDYNDNLYLIENIRPEMLQMPKGVSALAGDGQVRLTWSATGEQDVKYRVWRDTQPNVSIDGSHRVSGEDPLDEPEFTDTDVDNGTTYYYVVRAVIAGESNSESTPAVSATPNPVDDFEAKVNFQNQAAPLPAGYLKDFGQAYGPRTGADQGEGLSYGWLGEDNGQPVDLSVGGTTGPGNGRDRNGESDQRLDTLMHMQGDDVPDFNGTPVAGMWEIAVPDGSYEVTVAAGDPNTNTDPEIHTINVEGENAIDEFVPSGPAGSASHHETATVDVEVSDGRLTIDALGGTNTKINYVDIAATN